jgi:hypothetical protein
MRNTALLFLRSLALKRWMLICFALAMGVAHVSALIKPPALELLCSTNGALRLILQDSNTDNDQQAQLKAKHNTACALCMPLDVLAQEPTPPLRSRPDLSYSLRSVAAAPAITQALPALPARGPPDIHPLFAIV